MATGDASDKIESLLQKNRTRVYFAQHVAATYNIEICCVKSWVKIWPLLVDLKKETGEGGGGGRGKVESPVQLKVLSRFMTFVFLQFSFLQTRL